MLVCEYSKPWTCEQSSFTSSSSVLVFWLARFHSLQTLMHLENNCPQRRARHEKRAPLRVGPSQSSGRKPLMTVEATRRWICRHCRNNLVHRFQRCHYRPPCCQLALASSVMCAPTTTHVQQPRPLFLPCLCLSSPAPTELTILETRRKIAAVTACSTAMRSE